MNVINKKTLLKYQKKYMNAKAQLSAWYYEAKHSDWNGPKDIKEKYSTVSFLNDNKVFFNIKGNQYRLLVKINYPTKTVFLKWFGTHDEYNKKNKRREFL